MDSLLWIAATGVSAVISLLAAGHALLWKRDPRSALGWIVVSLYFPIIGPFLYWMLGINRISRKARRWQETGRRLPGREAFRAIRGPGNSPLDPLWAAHLAELARVGDSVTASPLIAGNLIVPLANGDAAYPAMLDAIGSARSSIHLSTYIFDGDRTGRLFVHALEAAAAREVEVRVLVDGLGERYSRPTARSLLKGPGVTVERFLPLHRGGSLNLRNHRKILVVDGRTGFTGGMNIGGRHMVARPETKFPVKDLQFMVNGPVVEELQRLFLEDWFFVTGQHLDDPRYFPPLDEEGGSVVRAIGDGPDKEFRKLHWMVMGALSCASDRVRVMTPYFIPDRSMVSALATAALRGIRVTLVLPERNNLPLVHWATRSYMWELLQSGIRIFYQPPPFVHTKLFLVDGLWSLIGSANLDPRSLRLNFELDLEVYDPDFGAVLERHFDEALARSREVTLEEMDRRPLPFKIRDGAAKLLSPYL